MNNDMFRNNNIPRYTANNSCKINPSQHLPYYYNTEKNTTNGKTIKVFYNNNGKPKKDECVPLLNEQAEKLESSRKSYSTKKHKDKDNYSRKSSNSNYQKKGYSEQNSEIESKNHYSEYPEDAKQKRAKSLNRLYLAQASRIANQFVSSELNFLNDEYESTVNNKGKKNRDYLERIDKQLNKISSEFGINGKFNPERMLKKTSKEKKIITKTSKILSKKTSKSCNKIDNDSVDTYNGKPKKKRRSNISNISKEENYKESEKLAEDIKELKERLTPKYSQENSNNDDLEGDNDFVNNKNLKNDFTEIENSCNKSNVIKCKTMRNNEKSLNNMAKSVNPKEDYSRKTYSQRLRSTKRAKNHNSNTKKKAINKENPNVIKRPKVKMIVNLKVSHTKDQRIKKSKKTKKTTGNKTKASRIIRENPDKKNTEY